jgi:hypothetical protein
MLQKGVNIGSIFYYLMHVIELSVVGVIIAPVLLQLTPQGEMDESKSNATKRGEYRMFFFM